MSGVRRLLGIRCCRRNGSFVDDSRTSFDRAKHFGTSVGRLRNAGMCKEWGYWGRALQYVLNNPLPDEEHYPYTHSDSPCKPAGGPHYGIDGWELPGGERRRCLRGHAKT